MAENPAHSTPDPAAVRPVPEKFLVALSFAGEQRGFVRAIAEAVENTLGRGNVFFDEWYEYYIAGDDADLRLQEIYSRCDMAVVCVSQRYNEKPWTKAEHRAIRARQMQAETGNKHDRLRVLPIRVGEGDVEGILSNAIVPDMRGRASVDAAKLITTRLGYLNQMRDSASMLQGEASGAATEAQPFQTPRVGNLRRENPMFVGREVELGKLAAAVGAGKVGVVTAVHGLGGMGKTELAVAFANQQAARFPAGLWMLNAGGHKEGEGHKELLPLLGELLAALSQPRSVDPNETGEQRGHRALAELERRVQATHNPNAACLVVLDNVSEPELLAGPQLNTLPATNWLRLVATTRLGKDRLRTTHPRLELVPVDALEEATALLLLEKYQPEGHWPAATADSDKVAARELVRDLDGFTLAVEAVAIFLGQHPEIRPAAYLARLRREGLASIDTLGQDPDVAAQMQHREKQLSLVLGPVIENLKPAERAALEYAALLPPDSIPWPWLRVTVEQQFPEIASPQEGYPHPWQAIRERLEGLRLLTPGNHPELTRLHRLVGKMVAQGLGERVQPMKERLQSTIYKFARVLEEIWEHTPATLWLLEPFKEVINSWQKKNRSRDFGLLASIIGGIESKVGYLDEAITFGNMGKECLEDLFHAHPDSEQAAGEVSIGLEKLADLLVMRGQQGDVDLALMLFQRCLEIREHILVTNTNSVDFEHNVLVSLIKLADLLARGGLPGDAEQALAHLQRAMEIGERLLAANPNSTQAARDVAISIDNLANLLANRSLPGDAEQALILLQRCLEIRERLLAANPNSAQAARDVLVSLSDSAGFLAKFGQEGDAEQALAYLQRGLDISERLLAATPNSALAERDVSFTLEKLADCLARRDEPGDTDHALALQARALKITQKLRENNPHSAYYAQDLARNFYLTAHRAYAVGKEDLANQCMAQCYEVLHELATANYTLEPPMAKLYQQLKDAIGGGSSEPGGADNAKAE